MEDRDDNVEPVRTRIRIRIRAMGILWFWMTPLILGTTYAIYDNLTASPRGHGFEYGTHGATFATTLLAIITFINTIGFSIAQVFTPRIAYRYRWRFWIMSGIAGVGAVFSMGIVGLLVGLLDGIVTGSEALWITLVTAVVLLVSFALSLGLIWLGFLTGFLQRPIADHCCQACGYDLRGSPSGVCPECGWTK